MTDLPTVPVTPAEAAPRRPARPRRGRRVQTTGTDRLFLVLMVAVPTALVVGLVWLPAVATVVLSFA
ncbi:MAG TPA: sugar ABC transporter permease, partial [Actinomycetes bacterium]|nr:sugar ABC transporter permease [Actinomycetes bacterium]